jgi:2,4-dienoyl-CoA reductase-like NADH-dependent reductase (Old Yellow Enzyme family)
MSTSLGDPLLLPNGTQLPNRIAKSATSEALAHRRTGRPLDGLVRLYERWGAGGAGLLVTGNVVIDRDGRTEPGNVVLDDQVDRDARDTLRRWATAAQHQGACAFMQLNHAGRQVPRRISHHPVAPSAVAVRGKGGLFARPRELGSSEIRALIDRFARAAEVAAEAGFAGVQLHAAHGYLINQFLSPLSNRRSDEWGGTPAARMRFLLETVRAVRERIGSSVAIAVKLNSADFQRGGFTEEESMGVVAALERERIDLLEISGGNYESSAMMGERASTKQREAYFLDYAVKVRGTTPLPLMLTGGLRTATAMHGIIRDGAVDVVGLARPLIVEPDLPARLLAGTAASADAARAAPRSRYRMVDDVLQIAWHQRQLRRMGQGRPPVAGLGLWTSFLTGFARNYAFNPFGALRRDRRRLASPLGAEVPSAG